MNKLFEAVDSLFESDSVILDEGNGKYGTIFVAEVLYNGVVGTCRGIGHTEEEAKENALKLFMQDYPDVAEDLLNKDDYKDSTPEEAVEDWYGINVFDLSSGATNEGGSTLSESANLNEDYQVSKDSEKIKSAFENLSQKIDSIALKYFTKDFGTALCKLTKIYHSDNCDEILDEDEEEELSIIFRSSYLEEPESYTSFATDHGSAFFVYLPFMIDYKNQDKIYYDGPEIFIDNNGGTSCVAVNNELDRRFDDDTSLILGGNIERICSVFDLEMNDSRWEEAYKVLLDKNEVVNQVDSTFKKVSEFVIGTSRKLGDNRRKDIATKQREYGNAIKSLESEDLSEGDIESVDAAKRDLGIESGSDEEDTLNSLYDRKIKSYTCPECGEQIGSITDFGRTKYDGVVRCPKCRATIMRDDLKVDYE